MHHNFGPCKSSLKDSTHVPPIGEAQSFVTCVAALNKHQRHLNLLVPDEQTFMYLYGFQRVSVPKL